MLSMRIDSMLYNLVKQELVGKGRKDEALHFHFDLRMAYADFREFRGLHMLYYLPPGMSYVTVFSAVTDDPFIKIGKVQEWKHETTHDSCWRDVQTFSNVYFAMADEINKKLEKETGSSVAPCEMREHNSFRLFGSAFDWVKVEVSRDPEDDRNYRRLVKLL